MNLTPLVTETNKRKKQAQAGLDSGSELNCTHHIVNNEVNKSFGMLVNKMVLYCVDKGS